MLMKNGLAFAVDPGDIPALKRWLAKQGDQSTLRAIDIDEILIGQDALLQLPQLLQREGLAPGARTLLVMDKTPMLRETQDLKLFVQALLRDAGYQVRPLWLEGDHYGLVHASFSQVRRVHNEILP